MHLLTLLSIFRMVVLPVQFQDRELGTTREQQQALVQQAQEYFNRQFAGTGTTFVFELAPATTLQHPVAWYGTNYPDRKDIRLADAVREACLLLKDQVDFAATDNDGDGLIDNIFLLYAGPGEHASGQESDIYPQQGWMPADGPALLLGGKGVRSFAVAPEGEPGVWCHEFAHALGLPDFYDTDGAESGGECPGLWGTSLMDDGCREAEFPEFGALEFHLLGLGREEALAVGPQLLQPPRHQQLPPKVATIFPSNQLGPCTATTAPTTPSSESAATRRSPGATMPTLKRPAATSRRNPKTHNQKPPKR